MAAPTRNMMQGSSRGAVKPEERRMADGGPGRDESGNRNKKKQKKKQALLLRLLVTSPVCMVRVSAARVRVMGIVKGEDGREQGTFDLLRTRWLTVWFRIDESGWF